MIIIKNIVKKNTLAKISNGTNIFNQMKSEYNKDNSIKKFVLDFDGILLVKPIVFKEIIKQMKSRLQGDYQLELLNANPMIKGSFQSVVRERT